MNRRYWLEMEKQERERGGSKCDEPATYPTDGRGQRMRNQVEPTLRVFIPLEPTTLLDLSHFLPAAKGDYTPCSNGTQTNLDPCATKVNSPRLVAGRLRDYG